MRAAVGEVLDRLVGPGAAADVCTSLAEGADRLVAQVGLGRGGSLVVLLPLEIDEYSNDFADGDSIAEFNELLAAADEVEVIAPPSDDDGSREAAYERAGLAVLDRSDVLLALWDGEPGRGRGGTAELVAEARRRQHPVEVVAVERAEG